MLGRYVKLNDVCCTVASRLVTPSETPESGCAPSQCLVDTGALNGWHGSGGSKELPNH